MRVLIVGGAGYIGARCAAALEASGCALTVVDAFVTGRKDALESVAAQLVVGDPREARVAGMAADYRPDVILYFAGVTDTRIRDRAWMERETVDPFRAVATWAQQWKVRLVYASSAAVYGNGPVPMKESQPASPHNAYGWAKLGMDRFAATLIHHGASVLGLRYFNVYGRGEQHKGATSSMIRQLSIQLRNQGRVRLFEHGHQRRDFVHIDDVVRATVDALNSDVTGILNVGSGTEHSFDQLLATIARAMKIDDPRVDYVPAPLDYQKRTWADLSRAATEMDFEPRVPFHDGVSAYALDEGMA